MPRHDLRSDTVTVPTEAMRRAMASARVGDDVLGEDPTVRRLEQAAARRLGKPAGLFVPSGTMGNQICLGLLTRPGDEIIAEEQSHILLNEGGAPSRFWGCQIRPVVGQGGVMDVDRIEQLIRDPHDVHYPRTSVVSLENTHNYAGGTCQPLEHIDAVAALARERGLSLHMDGARLFHAEVATGVDAARIVRDADLVSICLSKGLGAPVGSVVLGSVQQIEAGRRLRKALGGGMRQAGIVAAAGLLALEQGPAALAADHRRAAALADALMELPGVCLDRAAVQTNIVIVHTERPAPTLEQQLAERGVLTLALDQRRLRFVFHRDVGDEALEAAVSACRAVLATAGAR